MTLGRNSKGEFSAHGSYTMGGKRRNPSPKRRAKRRAKKGRR